MQSRHEVGHILRASGVDTIEFQASMVIGGGSLSFELLRALTNRLPVMLCPRWLATPTQPIAIDDVVAFLLAAQAQPPGAPRRFEIGGPEVVTYRDMIGSERTKVRKVSQGLLRALVHESGKR